MCEGINHVAFGVPDIKPIRDALAKGGYNAVYVAVFADGGEELHIDTGYGFYIQFVEYFRGGDSMLRNTSDLLPHYSNNPCILVYLERRTTFWQL